jgi:hypothetical protein
MACATEPIEAIDTTGAELVRDPVRERVYRDREHAAVIADRIIELTLMYMDRLDAEEIALLETGAITSQEALDLSEAEHEALFSEFQYLAAESEAIMAESERGFVLPQKNDGKGPQNKPETGCDAQADDCSFKATLGAGLAGMKYGLWVFVGIAVAGNALCLCSHCKGHSAIKTACEAMKQ